MRRWRGIFRSVGGGLLGVAMALATATCECRGRTFCTRYAEDVTACCPNEDYETHRSLCQDDFNAAPTQDCRTAMTYLYECLEDALCTGGCGNDGSNACGQQYQAVVGVCSQSPEPPADTGL